MPSAGWVSGDDEGVEGTPLEVAGAASIRGRVAFGARRGQGVRRLGVLPEFLLDDDDEVAVSRLRPHGFSLFASPPVSGTDRSRVERLIRYMARPAVSLERLSRRKDGLYVYELRTPWRDGTTAVVFSPLELIEKLAACACCCCAARSPRCMATPWSAPTLGESVAPSRMERQRIPRTQARVNPFADVEQFAQQQSEPTSLMHWRTGYSQTIIENDILSREIELTPPPLVAEPVNDFGTLLIGGCV